MPLRRRRRSHSRRLLIWMAGAVLAVVAASALAVALLRRGPSKEQYLARGTAYAAEKKYAEAIIELRNALKKDPNAGRTRAMLAEAYVNTGDVRSAIRETVVAADLLPHDLEAQLKAGQFLLMAGRYEDAKTRSEKVLALDSKNVTALILKANALAGLKDSDRAIEEINAAITLDPEDARSYAALGTIEMSKGRRDQAEAAFKRAVDAQPSSSLAQLSLASFYWSGGRLAEAEPILKRALALDPRNVIVQRALATYYLSTGRGKEAEVPLKAVVETLNTAQSRLALADYYLAAQRTDDARVMLKAVADERDGFGGATIRLAALDYQERHLEAAHRQIDAVMTKEPKNVDAMLVKARFLLTEKKIDEALARAKAAAAVDSRSAAAQQLLGIIHTDRGEVEEAIAAFGEVLRLSPRSLSAKLQLANLSLRKGAPEPALQYAEEILHDAPKHAGARSVLVRALVAKGEVNRASRELSALVGESPNVASLHSQMGALDLMIKDRAGARREFDRALALDPKSFDAFSGLVAADVEDNNGARAKAAIEERLKKDPQDPAILALAAATYGTLRETARQEVLLQRLIEVAPNNLQAFAGLASLYAEEDRLDEAKAGFEALALRAPRSVGVQTMIAVILQAQRRDAEAQTAYEKVLKLDPTAGLAANNLAWIYADGGGSLDAALDLAQTAKRQMPDVPQVNDTLGWVFYKKNLVAQAIPAFESSVRTSPKNPTYRYHLGLAYAKAGQLVKAREALDEALRQKPDLHEAADARKTLAASPS
jgi:tetratricopeptide (TPR) repeat protein